MSEMTNVLESTTRARSTGRQGLDRWFYVGTGLLVLALNIAGFAPSLIEHSTRTAPLPLPLLLTMHAIVSAGWVILLPIQATLIATHRTAVHRRLGMLGIALAIAFVVTAIPVQLEEGRRGFDLSGDLVPRGTMHEPALTLQPLNGILLFALLVGGGVWYRRRPEVHKRLMVFAALGPLSGAGIAHLSGHLDALRPYAAAI